MRIRQVVIDSNDPRPLADFWALATGREVRGDGDPYLTLDDPNGRDVRLLIQRVDDDLKPGKNPVHVDLFSDEPEAEAERLAEAGARVLEQHGEGNRLYVLADPQDNEFCIIRPS